MVARWRYALVAGLRACARVTGAETFADHLSTDFERPIANALAQSIGRSIPVPAASSGLTFELDIESGAFVRKTTLLGQLYLERAEPIGKRRWNVSVSYQSVSTDTIDGEDLDSLSDTDVPIRNEPGDTVGFTIPRFGIKLKTHQVITSVTYGITDNLEANLTVPVLYSIFDFDAVLVDRDTGVPQSDHVHASSLGIGDLFVRAKYRVLANSWLQAALGLV